MKYIRKGVVYENTFYSYEDLTKKADLDINVNTVNMILPSVIENACVDIEWEKHRELNLILASC